MTTPYEFGLDQFTTSSVVVDTSVIAQPLPRGFDFLQAPIAESIYLRQFTNYNLDTTQEYSDSSQEGFGTSTVEFLQSSYTADEITDNHKVVAVVLNIPLTEPVSVNWAVTGGTAQHMQDYTIIGGTSGTLTFNRREWIKFIPIDILAQALAQPERTIELTLSAPVGSGSYFPKFVLVSQPEAGETIFIFNQQFTFGSDIAIGATLAETAQNIAEYWNTNGAAPNHTVTAFYEGPKVSFTISGMEDVECQFYTDSAHILSYPGLSNTYSYYAEGLHNWTLSLGGRTQSLVTIESHASRPGITQVISYNPLTKRATKRPQIPTTVVTQLQETLDSFAQRLKNRGF